MKTLGYFLFFALFTHSAYSEQKSFNDDPDVYRGAFYGHLIAGQVLVEGTQLSPGESVVHTVSYVHVLKDGVWYRTAMVTSKLTCRIRSKETPGFSVFGIDAYLSIDGLKVLKVLPSLVSEGDDRLPKKACLLSNESEA